jgi:glutamate-1-semialdehyde 2,1-aminomutase
MSIDNNHTLFERAQVTTPGGVNSPVRAFRSVGGVPRFIQSASGATITDANGKRYIDYIGSWGPMIAGHAHPEVIRAVQAAAERGLSYGCPTEDEVVMAELLTQLVPSMAQVRLVSSGTEATMSALRLARGFTARDTIVKFEGCYHGHADSLLVKAGSGLLTFAKQEEGATKMVPSSGGVPADIAKHTLVLEYNHTQQLEDLFKQRGSEIACVIVEPIAGNMNFIRGDATWLKRMRELCTQYGAVLIWDEVMTGFRVGPQSAQGLYGITPDLSCFGKVIGGGMPIAAFGGRRHIMQCLSPIGNVYQAGTLSGNPVAVAAGMATLKLTRAPGFYDGLEKNTKALLSGLTQLAAKHDIKILSDSQGGMFGFYFGSAEQPTLPRNFTEVSRTNADRFKRFFHGCLDGGVYLAPSAFEAGFVSSAHTSDVINATLKVMEKAISF